jgi:hypothetical protein
VTTPTPAIPSFTDGTIVHQAAVNALASNLSNLYNFALGGFESAPPFCIANQTSTQSVTNNTYVPISFNTTLINVSNMWVASQPTQLTIQVAGTYILWGQVIWSGSTAGYRGQALTVNGLGVPGNQVSGQNWPNNPGGFVASSCFALYKLSAGATIYNMGWQNSGGALATSTGGLLNSSLAALWISQ